MSWLGYALRNRVISSSATSPKVLRRNAILSSSLMASFSSGERGQAANSPSTELMMRGFWLEQGANPLKGGKPMKLSVISGSKITYRPSSKSRRATCR